MPQVKGLRDKKATHQGALQLAQYLCNQIVSLPQNKASAIFRKSIRLAAEYGISEIVEMIIQKYPDIIYHRDPDDGKNVFLVAATYRFENVINLLYNMSDRKYICYDSTDSEDNNLMHICGKLAPSDRLNLVAGAALQMQRELQWFKVLRRTSNTQYVLFGIFVHVLKIIFMNIFTGNGKFCPSFSKNMAEQRKANSTTIIHGGTQDVESRRRKVDERHG